MVRVFSLSAVWPAGFLVGLILLWSSFFVSWESCRTGWASYFECARTAGGDRFLLLDILLAATSAVVAGRPSADTALADLGYGALDDRTVTRRHVRRPESRVRSARGWRWSPAFTPSGGTPGGTPWAGLTITARRSVSFLSARYYLSKPSSLAWDGCLALSVDSELRFSRSLQASYLYGAVLFVTLAT